MMKAYAANVCLYLSITNIFHLSIAFKIKHLKFKLSKFAFKIKQLKLELSNIE